MNAEKLFHWLRWSAVIASGLLALGVAVLWVRSYWKCDQFGYYSYEERQNESVRRRCWDRRTVVGSWRAGLFWVHDENVMLENRRTGHIDWDSGPPTEWIASSTSDPDLIGPRVCYDDAWATPTPRWHPLAGFHTEGTTNADRRRKDVVVPCWALLAAFLILPSRRLSCLHKRRWRQRHGLCVNCGYDLRASGAVCSECGHPRLPRTARPLGRRGGRRWVAATACVVGALLGVMAWGSLARVRTLRRSDTLARQHLPERVDLEVVGGTVIRFILIRPGRFTMGSVPDENRNQNVDETQHEVTITRPFYIGATPVTWEQYAALAGEFGSSARAPVQNLHWGEAVAFCDLLSKATGRHVRLPTEAEWEYACRAGTTTKFNTGPVLTRYDADHRHVYPANRVPQRQGATVGRYHPNPWGVYDMHGPVDQWCHDWYEEYPRRPVADPTGPERGTYKVLRGGLGARSGERAYTNPNERSAVAGARVVLDVDR